MGLLHRLVKRFGRRAQQESGPPEETRREIAELLARGDRDAALDLCDAVLLRWPDDRRALWSAAVMRIKKGDTEAAAAHFARIEETRTRGAWTARALRKDFMDPAKAARGEPYVAALEDVLVDTTHWSVVCGGRLFTREIQERAVANNPFVGGRVSPDGEQCVMSLPREPQRIAEPCVLLGSDQNYSHWVLRNLLKLSLLEAAAVPAAARFLVRQDLRRWQREYLDLLGIPEARLLEVPEGRVVACRSLFVPVKLLHHPAMAGGVAWLRARLAPHMARAEDANDLLFVSRREREQRRLLNEAELEAALAPLGFRTVVPGTMSVRDQIASFSRARVVVAPHGAALANMAFAPPHARLVEIASAAITHMGEFRTLCNVVGQRVRTIVSRDIDPSSTPSGKPAMHLDYRVKVDDVLAAVRELL